MFVVFEGIDGSGKTTLSDRVSALLEKEGVSTFHARPKGELKSKLASRIREMARDPRTLTMSPHTELLLYLARDCQMIDTVIRPALHNAELVIADRYVYSPGILSQARGEVDAADIDTATNLVARGLWPDLVVYCDVDIHTSDLRKKLDKIVNLREPNDFGRKGLRGLGLRRAMRDAYLQKATDNPQTWVHVDNATKSVAENAVFIANHILQRLKRPPIEMPAELPKPIVLQSLQNNTPRTPIFYDYLHQLAAQGYHRMALHHARSLDDEHAWALREKYADAEPEVVALGIEPLNSERALRLRHHLADVVPRHVALSLKTAWADADPQAFALRQKLLGKAPIEVAQTLNRLDTDEAWQLRERLWDDKDNRGAVLSSLRYIDTERAWELRRKAKKGRLSWGLLQGLAGIDTDEAWALRERWRRDYLPWVILSLQGIDTERAWAIRRDNETRATKLVSKSTMGLESDEAWDMRDRQALWDKEAVSSIKGSDHPRAWQLRERLIDVWPMYVAKSVGLILGQTERGRAFMERMAEAHPHDPEVAHYLVKLEHVAAGETP